MELTATTMGGGVDKTFIEKIEKLLTRMLRYRENKRFETSRH